MKLISKKINNDLLNEFSDYDFKIVNDYENECTFYEDPYGTRFTFDPDLSYALFASSNLEAHYKMSIKNSDKKYYKRIKIIFENLPDYLQNAIIIFNAYCYKYLDSNIDPNKYKGYELLGNFIRASFERLGIYENESTCNKFIEKEYIDVNKYNELFCNKNLDKFKEPNYIEYYDSLFIPVECSE